MEMGDGGGQQARADFQATKRHDTDLGYVDAKQALHAVPSDLEPAPRNSPNQAPAAQRKRQLTEPTPEPNPAPGVASGAAEGTRTLDIQLGKLTLYQLSYGRSRGERVRAGAREPDSPGGLETRPSERSGNVSLDPGDGASIRLREWIEQLDAEAARRLLQLALGDAELRERLVAMTEPLDGGAEDG